MDVKSNLTEHGDITAIILMEKDFELTYAIICRSKNINRLRIFIANNNFDEEHGMKKNILVCWMEKIFFG